MHVDVICASIVVTMVCAKTNQTNYMHVFLNFCNRYFDYYIFYKEIEILIYAKK